MCLEIYDLDLTSFLTAPGLARQAALKKTKAKLDLLTDIQMLSYSFDTFFYLKSILISVKQSNFTMVFFKAACHTNPCTVIK